MSRWILPCVCLALVLAGCTAEPVEQPSTSAPEQQTTSTTPTTTTTTTTTIPPVPDPEDPFEVARFDMVETQIANRDVTDPVVLDAMRAVPRHEFVPADFVDQAYNDHPLPIGHGQTISQPYIVAWMSDLLDVEPGAKVLEIGTGSGYQAAVLAEMGVEVYTVEIIPALATEASTRLQRLGYAEVATLQADGYFGWEEHAPFDAIIVTAAPDHLPQPLLLQLEQGAHMVIPVGPVGAVQTMWRFTLIGEEVLAENLGFVSFVPLTREEPSG